MKYTDSKNNITFNNVKEAGVYHASGPIGLNGLYTTSGANITDINSNLSLINAIDINWNGALVEPGVELNTTGDLLRWIKEHSGGSQGNVELTINNQGYWCINGVSTGVKAQGEDGLTPHIGSNGNWWIGNTDTGVSANAKTIVENNISYTSDISGTTAGNYRLGTLNVGTSSYPILGKDLGGENISVSYLDSVGTNVQGRYTIGTLQIGNNTPITLNGINTVGEGGGSVIPNISATASIDGGTGTPSVTVTKSGSNESPNFNFAFHNLKGEQGIPGSGGEGGTTYIENPYDDNPLKNRLTAAESTLSTLRSLFETLHKWTQTEIEGLINGALDDWDWISQLTPGKIFNLSGWNDTLKAYILLVINTDADGNGATWSSLILRFNSLDGTILGIKETIAAGGQEIDYEYLASLIHLGIEDIDGLSTAIAKFETAYTEFQNVKGEITTIKSDISGLKTTANSHGATLEGFASSIQTLEGQVGTLESLSALLLSSKTDLESRMASAEASLATKATLDLVDGKLSTALAGYYTKSEVDDKISTAKAEVLANVINEDTVNGIVSAATSDMATEAYVDDEIARASASLIANSSIYEIKVDSNGIPVLDSEGRVQYIWIKDGSPNKEQYDDPGNGYKKKIKESATSGFVTKTEVYTKELTDGLIASARSDMMSEIDGEYAKITTAVTKTDNGDGTYSIDSNIKLDANLIEVNGTTLINYIDEGWNPEGVKIEESSIEVLRFLDEDGDKVTITPGQIVVYNYDIDSHTNTITPTQINLFDPTAGNTTYGINEINFETWDKSKSVKITADPNNGSISVVGSLSLSPDGTNGTFLAPYGLYSVYNKSYSGSWGGEQLRIKLSLQTGSNDDSTVECAVNNIKLLGNYVSVGNFDGGASGMIVRDSNVELRSQTNIKFDNIITLAPAINGTEKIIANFLYNDNDLEIETPNGVCKIPDLYSDSDETIKENITEVSSNILDIANARIVDFNFKGKSTIKFGSIAQDWKNIFPNAVKETTSGILCMDYGAIALGSAVTAAREIVALKEENQQLKDRLAVIEQKLEAINSALG